jgi:hypothetical protein
VLSHCGSPTWHALNSWPELGMPGMWQPVHAPLTSQVIAHIHRFYMLPSVSWQIKVGRMIRLTMPARARCSISAQPHAWQRKLTSAKPCVA